MNQQWTIPGTVLTIKRSDAVRIPEMFQTMFLTGGVVLSQVTNITGLEPYAVQNWVKRGFLRSPKHKQYDLDQLCRVILINTFKNVLPMERICGLLSYVNGRLDDASDDIIRDSDLYFMFVRLAGRAREIGDAEQAHALIEEYLSDYAEPTPGARERVAKALRVMLIAWLASRMRQAAEMSLAEMEMEE